MDFDGEELKGAIVIFKRKGDYLMFLIKSLMKNLYSFEGIYEFFVEDEELYVI